MLIDPSKTPSNTPLAALSKGFAEYLRRQGYAPRTILQQQTLLRGLSDWLQMRELTASDLSMAQVDRFLSDRRSAGATRPKSRNGLVPILGYLRELGVSPVADPPGDDGPTGKILNQYLRFLTTERGLVPTTALRYTNCLRPFLDRRVSADGLELGMCQ